MSPLTKRCFLIVIRSMRQMIALLEKELEVEKPKMQ